jgi:hypothetical protein
MISLLGPPPKEFLNRGDESLVYWDENGGLKSSSVDGWKSLTPVFL